VPDRPPEGPDTCELDRCEDRRSLDAWSRRWLHHLHTGCKRCWASLADRSKPEESLDTGELARILEKAQAEAPHLFAETVIDREAANRFVDRLTRLSPEHQRLVIANSQWAANPAVCGALIDRSVRARFVDPSATLLLAELAAQMAQCQSSDFGSTLVIRALTALGAARRLTSNFDEAARVLADAEEVLKAGVSNPQLLAEIKSIQTALNTSRGQFGIALRQN
jgi:hypothetical protein